MKNLEICYNTLDGRVNAVNGVDLSVCEGQTLGLVGETGAGKTSTALGILRLLPKKTGEMHCQEMLFDGRDLTKLPEYEMRRIRGGEIAMIFQDPMTSLNPLHTVGQQIAEVIKLHQDIPKEEVDKHVDLMMNRVNLPPGRKHEYPHQFSGGMKQRIVIAIALACNPRLLIADEPTTALDVTVQAQILNKIDELKQDLNTAMLLITHDLGIVAETCDHVAVMYAGEIVETGTLDDVFNNMQHPYTVGLFNSVPNMEEKSARLEPIRGLMPDPMDLPGGCKFHPRCPKAVERCNNEMPPVREKTGHKVRCFFAFGGSAD